MGMRQGSVLTLFAALVLQACSMSVGGNGNDDGVNIQPPELPQQYHVKGVLYLPYAELVEPIEGWVDLKQERSRLDYYGGMMKVYQYGLEGNGKLREIVPVTKSRQEANIPTCLEFDNNKGNPVEAQRFLPDLKDFKMVGREFLRGHVCEKWQKVEDKKTKVNTYTLWIRYHDGKVIPVKYQLNGYNDLFFSHYDHYYLIFDEYEDQIPDMSVMEIDPTIPCPTKPQPNAHRLHMMNPLKELIDNDDTHTNQIFDDFKNTHAKEYKDDKEHDLRKFHFMQNLRYINSKNRAGLSYKLAVNQFADRTPEERRLLQGSKHRSEHIEGELFTYTQEDVKSLPDYLDWRIAGAVTPVKDQAACGSCWAFGAVGAVEGAYFLKHGRRMSFSEQALVDCSWGEGNHGCDGGYDVQGYKWIMESGGLPSDEDYGGYLGVDAYCHSWNVTKSVVLDGYKRVNFGDIDGLKVAVNKYGPIAVTMDAQPDSSLFYASGVYYDPTCTTSTTHAVLLVGYGTLYGTDYWLIKNSWSTHWGNDGYILIAQENNHCGVASTPVFPILK